MAPADRDSPPRYSAAIGAVVTVGWLATVVAAVATGDSEPLKLVTPVMVILAGYLFGVEIVRRRAETPPVDRYPDGTPRPPDVPPARDGRWDG